MQNGIDTLSQHSYPWGSILETDTILMFTQKQMFTKTLFIIAKNWKQSKCSSTSKLVSSCASINRDKLLIFIRHWMNLKGFKLKVCFKRLPTKRHTNVLFMTFFKRLNCRDGEQISAAMSWGRGSSYWSDRIILYPDHSNGYTNLHLCWMHRTVQQYKNILLMISLKTKQKYFLL